MDFSNVNVMELVMKYALPVVYAIAAFIIGSMIVGAITKLFKKILDKNVKDPSLSKFLVSLANGLLKVILFITVAGIVGIDTTSFAAVIAAAGLAIGMALQGSLGNFAGGVMIILFKPFKVGDYIAAGGQEGIVKEIQIFCTILNTVDNKTIIIPNGGLSNGTITNFTKEEVRRVDLTIGIGYDDDIRTAKKILGEIANAHALVLKEPSVPVVVVTELGDSCVNIAVRSWAKTGDYWTVYCDLLEEIKYKLDANNINIPYPQMDVHVNQQA